MKKTILMGAAAIALISTTAFATVKGTGNKEGEIPAVVLNAFKKEYPNVKKVDWEKEDGNYEAKVEEGKIEFSVTYDAKGIKLEVETEISAKELPANILNYIKQHNLGKVKEADKTVKADGSVEYEVEAGKKDLIFDGSGNFVKVEQDEKD